ncbi:unnamed protein product [Linum tenue]|uniref:Uncharacterized protein n=1 Tax=Linum tenue TaxID=586396 RepID=A0AAV0RRB0_9ROSI|nr:unnamed protein product [Linum tenue]
MNRADSAFSLPLIYQFILSSYPQTGEGETHFSLYPFSSFIIFKKMGRAPCCEKMGLNRGPWTPEEDQILISYIRKHGHSNWRALPKLAGLLRCGKSCRLRWINYLNPDIKRGNFTREEEDAIINLHESLGNRWSAIAAKLPGRTDNEIKNVWHTHLKKRLRNKNSEGGISSVSERQGTGALSPQPSISAGGDVSSVTENTISTAETRSYDETPSPSSVEQFPLIDESLWSEPEAGELMNYSPEVSGEYLQFDDQFDSLDFSVIDPVHGIHGPSIDDAMDFWYDLFVQAGGVEGFPELQGQ